MEIKEIIAQMSLEDKIKLCTGADFWHIRAMEKYGIPAISMSDGPHGLRCQEAGAALNINQSVPATCFPTAVTAGASWNRALYAAEGRAIGEEAVAAGVDIVLGPGCNIKRDPLCGRNFEYLSEDPYLSGELAGAFIAGQQGAGVLSCLKHFAANNQEFKRQNGDSLVDERTLREIYLAPIERAVKTGRPGTVMCAYNKLNGVHCSDNAWLLTDVLRQEWGFDGAVITDWGALHDRIKAFRAGCDLNMPGGAAYMEKAAGSAVRKGELDEAYIDASVERILRIALREGKRDKEPFDELAHDTLARVIAEQGAMLLKNEDGILPVKAEDMVLIGHMAKDLRYQGAGSSHINPTHLTSLTDALPETPFFSCCDANGDVTEAALKKAAEKAKSAAVAVVAAGLPDSFESEGFDRESMAMPQGHVRMIEAVAAANSNTVVVLFGGGAMETPWLDKVKAVLYMGLPGQAGGAACANLLTGKACPGGKLTESWPIRYEDAVSSATFGDRNPEYREGIYVGYRYYDKAEKPVRFPFGHGLSYTRFEYSDLRIDGRTVTATVTNTGSVAGAEVVQLYICPPQKGIHRPVKELKGFDRIELQPGQSGRVTFHLEDRSFALWADGWKTPGGTYEICLAASSRDIRLREAVEIAGEQLQAPAWQMGSWYETCRGEPSREDWETAMGRTVPVTSAPVKGQFTMDSTILEMKDASLAMKLLYKGMEMVIAHSFGGKKPEDPAYKMMLTSAVDCPLRGTVICGGGALSEPVARGLLEMANGHFFRGLAAMIRG